MAEGMGGKIIGWAEAHPLPSVLIGVTGLLGVLWLFGAFKGAPAAQGDGGQTNMAAAYYAAEAQQAVVGGQIQVATIGATRDTAIAGLETDAAVKMNKTNAHAAVTINQQNSDTTTKLGDQALNATYSNNDTLVKTTSINANAATTINAANNKTSSFNEWLHSILPIELANHGQGGFVAGLGDIGSYTSTGTLSPDMMRQAGYGEDAIAAAGGGTGGGRVNGVNSGGLSLTPPNWVY